MKRIVYVLMVFFPFLWVNAQEAETDTIVELETVTVSANRDLWSSTGQSRVRIGPEETSLAPGSSLAEIAGNSTPVSITSYGPGTLSTLRIRGTSANHAGLVWNGIRLSPPNMGYLDLSLIPVDFFDEVFILYGGGSPLFGSGFIGGSLHLDNLPRFEQDYQNLKASFTAGSFHSYRSSLKWDRSGKAIHNSTNLTWRSSKNNFSYPDYLGDKKKLPHAELSQFGVLESFGIRLKGDQFVQGIAWIQYADRNIPPTLTEARSAANQIDRSFRTLLQWKDKNPKTSLEARGSYFNEFTRYKDSITGVYSVIRSQTYTASFGSDWRLTADSRLYTGVSFHHDQADLTAYVQPQTENNTAAFLSYYMAFPKAFWELTANLRQELIDDHWSPFIFSFGTEGRLFSGLKARLSLSRNYRTPTLNEKYWQPGGDPGLLPESSWNQEIGLAWESLNGEFRGPFELTAFSSVVDNWILWVPEGMLSFVQNRQKVWARGFEVSGNLDHRWRGMDFKLNAAYAMTKSTNEKRTSSLDEAFNKQLVYMPRHRMVLKLGISYKGYRVFLRNTYTSKVFITSDNRSSFPGYYLVDGFFIKSLVINDHQFEFQININNMTNREYQSVPYRPMPGINILVVLSYQFLKSQFKNNL